MYRLYIMSEWSKLVAKLCKENPGKPLGSILVEAKKQYKKSKGLVKSAKPIKSRKNKSRKNK